MKKIIAVCTTALLTVGLAISAVATASATEQYEGVCVPSEAWTEVIAPEVPATPGTPAVYETHVTQEAGWQRYSWTGGPHAPDSAPAFPSEDWQPNTKSDPHGVGVEGAYFRSNGNSGNGDWFYLEATPEESEQVLVTPAVPGTPVIPAVTVDHPAVTCGGEPEEPTTTTPLPPLFEDVCGTANDVTRIPDNTDEYSYVGDVTEAGLATVTATAAKGFIFDSGYDTLTWTFEFTNEACPVVVPPVVYPPTEQPPVAVPPVVQPPVLPNCDDLSYESAQELLASDSTKYGYLDNNKDGIACDALAATPVVETLPETGTDTSGTLFAGGAAFLLLMAGAAALLFKRREATE